MKSIYLESVDSTNQWAKLHVSELENMSLVYTYKQTKGRGRLDRAWTNVGVDNIYASLVLKDNGKIREVHSNLTQYLCVILAETFEEYGIVPKIKWPNDILVNGKKISGILAESIGVRNDGHFDAIILGFGVNLNASQDVLDTITQPATSLNIESGMFVDKEEFLKKVTDRFFLMYDKFIEEGFLLIKEEYVKRASFLNKNVTVDVFGKIVSGTATEIAENGALKIVDNNEEHILLIGDIL